MSQFSFPILVGEFVGKGEASVTPGEDEIGTATLDGNMETPQKAKSKSATCASSTTPWYVCPMDSTSHFTDSYSHLFTISRKLKQAKYSLKDE